MEETDVSIRREESMDLQTIVRRPMSLAEFDALPSDVRAEYVDGVALMTPPARLGHNWTADEIRALLRGAGLVAVTATGVLVAGQRRIPDVVAFRDVTDEEWSTQVPVVTVEVLSPSTRDEDLFRKAEAYRRGGVEEYWVVDREAITLTVLANEGAHWRTALALDAQHPVGAVGVEGCEVSLDLDALLGP